MDRGSASASRMGLQFFVQRQVGGVHGNGHVLHGVRNGLENHMFGIVRAFGGQCGTAHFDFQQQSEFGKGQLQVVPYAQPQQSGSPYEIQFMRFLQGKEHKHRMHADPLSEKHGRKGQKKPGALCDAFLGELFDDIKA